MPAFSLIMIEAALVLPDAISGMIEKTAYRRPAYFLQSAGKPDVLHVASA